jgi:predicted MPP superfamily phosphohydrolase
MIEIAMAAGVVGLGAYAALVEPRRLVRRALSVPSPLLPAGWRPLRAVVVSDLHAGWPHVTAARLGRLATAILAERPDVVLLPGDFVCEGAFGTRPLAIEAVAEALAALPASVPTFAVLGNHDRDVGPRRVAAALESVGIVVLYNRAVPLARPGGAVWIAGVDCARTGRPDLGRALAGIPTGAPVILLSHIPDLARRVPDWVALTVAGHTHGGQVCIPGLGPLVTMSRLPRRMARGLHRLGDRHLFVSTGIGTSGLPLRLAAVPELAVLTLEPAVVDADEPVPAGERVAV